MRKGPAPLQVYFKVCGICKGFYNTTSKKSKKCLGCRKKGTRPSEN